MLDPGSVYLFRLKAASIAVMLAGGTWPCGHVCSGGGRRSGGTGRGAAAVGHCGASGRDRVGQAGGRRAVSRRVGRANTRTNTKGRTVTQSKTQTNTRTKQTVGLRPGR